MLKNQANSIAARRHPQLTPYWAAGLSFSRGRRIVLAEQSGAVGIYNLFTAERLQEFPPHRAEITAMRYMPRDRCLVTASWDRSLHTYDELSPEVKGSLIRQVRNAHVADVAALVDGALGERAQVRVRRERLGPEKLAQPLAGRRVEHEAERVRARDVLAHEHEPAVHDGLDREEGAVKLLDARRAVQRRLERRVVGAELVALLAGGSHLLELIEGVHLLDNLVEHCKS